MSKSILNVCEKILYMRLFLPLALPCIMKDLGNILKSLRISKGISQDALAFEMEISLSTYSKLERGLTDITLSKLEKLAAFYGMDVVEVLLYGSSPLVAPNICKKLIEEKDREIMNLQKDLIEALKKKP